MARAFLPIAREAAVAATERTTHSVQGSSKGLSSSMNLAVRGARYETSNYMPRSWLGASRRVPFVVPAERLPAIKEEGEMAEKTKTSRTQQSRSTSSTPTPPSATTPTIPTAATAATTTTTTTADGEASVSSKLTVPPLDELRKLNPELAAVVERHEQQKRAVTSVRDVILATMDTHGVESKSLNKTAVNKLKVNALREVLTAIGSDARGNKAALVARIFDELRKDEENVRSKAVAEDLGAGVASRKQIIRLQQAAHSRTAAPIAQTTATVQTARTATGADPMNVKYTRVFGSPDDVAQILVNANASDVTIVNVMHNCAFTDYMIIASANSHQSVHMVAAAVLHELKQRCKEVAPGVAPSVEGADDPSPDWLVVDAGSIVVHVFREESRSEYDLEGLWGLADKSNVVRVAAKQKLTIRTMQS